MKKKIRSNLENILCELYNEGIWTHLNKIENWIMTEILKKHLQKKMMKEGMTENKIMFLFEKILFKKIYGWK